MPSYYNPIFLNHDTDNGDVAYAVNDGRHCRRSKTRSSGVIVGGDKGKQPQLRDGGGSAATSPSFYCPLTMGLMKDPVQDREGNSYEKGAIVKWLAENETSPITRNRLRRKHLVPNRALKEAIDHEATKGNTYAKIRKYPSAFETVRHDANISTAPAAGKRASTTVTVASSTKQAIKNHHHTVINNLLSSLNVKSQIDEFGIALLQMSKLQPTINDERIKMLMVIEAPPAKETFRLYTHFNGSMMERQRSPSRLSNEEEEPTTTVVSSSGNGSSKNENQVFTNLLRHGRHEALTLTKVCDGRVRFSFEGKNSEIGCERKVRGILNMFVKVSFRMKKRIER